MSIDTIEKIYEQDLDLQEKKRIEIENKRKIKRMVHRIAERDTGHPGIAFMMTTESGENIVINGVKIENGEYYWLFNGQPDRKIQATDEVYWMYRAEII